MNASNFTNQDDKPFDFLQYLRECHRHYRTIEPQTSHSIAERRRYASIYKDMRAIEPTKGSGVGR